MRAIDDREMPHTEGYIEVDARIGWQLAKGFKLVVAGANRLDSQHPETGELATLLEVRRSVSVGARWRF